MMLAIAVCLVLVMQACVICISSDSQFDSPTTGTRGCGSYREVFSLTDASDRIADNARTLIEFGGVASLHSSNTNFGSATHKCGGVLISNRHILTAAHCMIVKDKPLSISLGRQDLEEDVSRSPDNNNNIYLIEEVIIHPDYRFKTGARHDYNDIAILKTKRTVQYENNIWPFCLPVRGQVFPDYMPTQIAGWGFINQFHKASTIKQAFVKIVDDDRCVSEWRIWAPQNYENIQQFSYPQGLGNKILCAGRPGVDACNGDSGGPMSYQTSDGHYTVIGLIAKGIPCADFPRVPGFYTNVAEFTDWIYASTGLSQPQPSSLLSKQPENGFNRTSEVGNGEKTSFCPRLYGRFADPNPVVCDTYYNCHNGVPKKIVCSSGLHFDKKAETCGLPKNANRQNCGENQACPQLYGTFADPDPAVCDTYYDCINGVPKKLVCGSGLHFDKNAGTCSWPRVAGRQNCEKKNPEFTTLPTTTTATCPPIQCPANCATEIKFDSSTGCQTCRCSTRSSTTIIGLIQPLVPSSTPKSFPVSQISPSPARRLALPDPQLCSDRPKQWQHANHNYLFSWDQPEIGLEIDPVTGESKGKNVDWMEARNQCRIRCMDAVGMETEAENNMIFDFIRTRNITYIWTSGRLCDFKGCSDRADLQPLNIYGWFWSNTNTKIKPTNSTPSSWVEQPWGQLGHAGGPQPDNAEYDINQTSESCLGVLNGIYGTLVKWHDIACYHKKPFICEDSDLLLEYVQQRNPNIRL